MNQQASRPQHVRADRMTSEIVEQAIAAIPAVGLRQAAEFLSAMHVPASVAIRTLVYPQQRRRN